MFLTTNSGNDINVKFLYVVCYMQVLAFYFVSQIVKMAVCYLQEYDTKKIFQSSLLRKKFGQWFGDEEMSGALMNFS